MVAAGAGHSLALKSDGTVWAWGLNSSGQLGDGTTTTRTTPVQVDGLSNVIEVAAGAEAANGCLIDHTYIPSIHDDVFVALGRTQPPPLEGGALGILESFNVATLILAADAAAKAALESHTRQLAMELGPRGRLGTGRPRRQRGAPPLPA